MAQPVWVLSVDLQTKTASFQTGMAEAAKSARGAFSDIGAGAGHMGEKVEKGSIDVRHSIGLVDNFIRGAHAQAIADLVRMYGKSAIVMSALPLAATAAGIGLIGGIAYEVAEHIKKMREEAEKLRNALTEQNTTGNNAFRQLDNEILQAEKRADELKNDHLGALKAELKLIDNQSMDELVKSFGMVEKAADAVFKETAAHWYSLGSGSSGATHALEQFKLQYDNLLSKGRDKDASDLLHGTLTSAKTILALQKDAAANSGTLLSAPGAHANIYRGMQDQLDLKKAGVGFTKDEVQAQEALITALTQQVGVEERVNVLKKTNSGAATGATAHDAAQRAAAIAKASAASQLGMGESALAGEKAMTDAQLSIHRAGVEARLASDLSFAGRERDVKEAANQAEIAALDKSGKDYQVQLKALNDKSLEIQQQYATAVAGLRARASVETNQRDVQAVEQGIREQIAATDQGSAVRLAAIDAGIREAQARQLQDTDFYRALLTERVNAVRQESGEEASLAASAARESADNTVKMGELSLAAEKQQMAMADSGRRVSDQQRMAEAEKIANEEYVIKYAALEREVQGLDKSGKEYQVKLKQLQDREKQLTQSHENDLTAIKEKAEMERNQRVLSAESQFQDSISRGLTQSIMGHETWSRMLLSLSDEVVSGMIQNAIKSMMADDMTKERDAASAARKAFNIGLHIGGPAGIVLGPVMGAAAFAAVMAFHGGTDGVPGVGRSDVVPAMLTPGEGVVPGGVMDGLRNVARNGGFHQAAPHIHVHMSPVYHVQTIDGDGMQATLEKHADQLQSHFENTLRRMNK